MNIATSIPQNGLENPSFYTQTVTEFSKITRLLEENNIRVQDNMHMGRDFIEAMIRVVQNHFPINASLFRTAYSELSQKDRKNFSFTYVQPFLLTPFYKRTQELLARKG
jgi:hypothetical protein